MIKKIFVSLGILSFLISPCFAFVCQMKILNKDEIRQLSDEQLVDAYIDAVAEVEACQSFHQTSGFKPQDYIQLKEILKCRLLLKQEIKKRNLQAPDVDRQEPAKEEQTSAKPLTSK